ncbi:hypothetical protein L3N51_02370 [Metallosphaera sp. J1]|uniref:hypothetical protein n=1 Tax=Metallosphaera javensis (ex Hofmann et al. 2022) TaxID=99938 RepID=UPI001EDEC1C6|nr:hypothetical protein [Metallosphaera javensis (ex Hofmann et al. 2022)]MCG3110073.1 hypothetical protein [Metallosphaera javensis (ex Hofmann et al. 2022)]
MRERERRLIEKVGRYYFAYRGKVNLESLLARGLESVEVDTITRYFLLSSVAISVINRALHYFDQAKRARLTYREFAVEYDSEPMGVVNVPRSLHVMSKGIYAYYTYIKGYDAPEYAIMNYLLHKIYEVADRCHNIIKNVHEEIKYFRIIDELKQKLQELEQALDYFRGSYYRPLTIYDPIWLRETYKLYKMLSELETKSFGTRSGVIVEREEMIKLVLWRLYEIYIFFLVVKYLEGEGFTVKKEGEAFVVQKGDKEIQLILNKDLDISQLESVDNLDNVNSFRGRPDLSLKARRTILIECKYSNNVSYITASRFKIMAYAYEYDPITVILAYPGLDEKWMGGQLPPVLDVEERATFTMNEIAKREGFIEIAFKSSKKLYIVVLDPSDEDDKNISKIARIFTSNDYLKSLL